MFNLQWTKRAKLSLSDFQTIAMHLTGSVGIIAPRSCCRWNWTFGNYPTLTIISLNNRFTCVSVRRDFHSQIQRLIFWKTTMCRSSPFGFVFITSETSVIICTWYVDSVVFSAPYFSDARFNLVWFNISILVEWSLNQNLTVQTSGNVAIAFFHLTGERHKNIGIYLLVGMRILKTWSLLPWCIHKYRRLWCIPKFSLFMSRMF